jgi:C4-dicarboxylate-binding protein DctP
MYHKGFSLTALAVATVVVGLYPLPSRAAKPIEFVMTNQLASTHWAAKNMEKFAAEIEKRSGGRIKPRVFNSGTLFKDKEAVAALGSGAVQMVWPVSVQLESIAPEYGVINLPFSMRDDVMLKKGARKAVASMLSKYVLDKGIRVMGLMRTADLIFLFKNKAVTKPSDLKGEKVRVTGGRVLQELMREFGASPISMSASEMGTAMMQGAIDGIFTSAGGWKMVGVKTAGVATRVPGLSLLTYSVLVDNKWLNSLPDDLRSVIVDTTNEILATQWTKAIASDKKFMAKLIAGGGKLVVV